MVGTPRCGVRERPFTFQVHARTAQPFGHELRAESLRVPTTESHPPRRPNVQCSFGRDPKSEITKSPESFRGSNVGPLALAHGQRSTGALSVSDPLDLLGQNTGPGGPIGHTGRIAQTAGAARCAIKVPVIVLIQ